MYINNFANEIEFILYTNRSVFSQKVPQLNVMN